MRFRGKNPLKTWKVKSQNTRHPDTGEFLEYTIEWWGENDWTCNCWGYKNRKNCKHILQIKDENKSN